MKKTSLFFILILSVFFSYKTAFASIYSQPNDSVRTVRIGGLQLSGLDGIMTGLSGSNFYVQFPMDYNSATTIYAFRIADFDTDEVWYATSIGATSGADCYSTPNMTGNGSSGKFTLTLDTSSNIEFQKYPCGSNLTFNPADHYRLIIDPQNGYGGGSFAFYGSSATLDNDMSILLNYSAPIPVDGIASQLTPVASSAMPYNMTFTGTYNNYSGTYRVLIATTTTGTPSIYASTSGTISTGVGLSYTLPLVLSPNQTYSYTMIMCDASGVSCTSPTSPVSFSTNGLTGAISPPVWTAEPCTWTDFSTWTGCLDNVFHDLFSPSSESLNQYQGLYAQFINKPPFGYVVAIQSALAGINDTNTSFFTLQSMPLLNTMIFDPIRTSLIWVLWVAFAFVLYHRLKNIAI